MKRIIGLILIGSALGCNSNEGGAGGIRNLSSENPASNSGNNFTPLPNIPPTNSKPPTGNSNQPPVQIPLPTPIPKESPETSTRLGSSCHSDDPNQICLSLKYVVYNNSNGEAVVSKDQVIQNLKEINTIWSQCKIAFQIDEFLPVSPNDYALNYNTASYNELTVIRNRFEDDSKLLVVSTGPWGGSLGGGSANAWTSMPGEAALGVVLEASVADFGNIIAHELGHYLNLDHYSNSGNVMNAIIYPESTDLFNNQCSEARGTAQEYWKAMYR